MLTNAYSLNHTAKSGGNIPKTIPLQSCKNSHSQDFPGISRFIDSLTTNYPSSLRYSVTLGMVHLNRDAMIKAENEQSSVYIT